MPPGSVPYRAVRLTLPRSIPSILTVGLPLFWTVILAAPRTRRLFWDLVTGSILLALPAPFLLLVCAVHLAKPVLFPAMSGPGAYLIDLTAYLATAVIPCVVPVLVALAFHRDLREKIVSL